MNNKRLLLYYGNVLLGDVNKYAKKRHLVESLKSEQSSATADTFTFEMSWKVFQEFISQRFDENPGSFLKVGKTRMIFEIDGRPRFAGWLASKPARNGLGPTQTLSLTFYEYFARLSGDVVCAANNKNSAVRNFTNRPAHLFVQDLINEFKSRAAAAGETLNWDYGTVNTLGNKTKRYSDFQTVSKALCDAMNNVSGAGKFDVVFRTDPEDYTHQLIDILQPRGTTKNIIIKYPSDGVYKLWANNYSVAENNEYASEVLVAGNGQVGDAAAGEQTAAIGSASNSDFVEQHMYWRVYSPQSNLESQDAVNNYAETRLSQLDFENETPEISLIGRPIEWGAADNMDNGLAIGDSFYFQEDTDDDADHSGFYRIIGMDTKWDDNGVDTVTPTLMIDE